MSTVIRNYKAELIKHLTRATVSGHSQDQVFEDWLSLVEASLTALPDHLKAARETGKPAPDSPETQKLFTTLKARYGKHGMEAFQQAFAVLLDSTEEYQDLLGQVYMDFAYANTHTGQFFTPWNIALMMARTNDISKMVHERLIAAIHKSSLATAMLLTGITLDGEEAEKWYFEKVLPAALEHYEPVTIHDPACGSGVMLLAVAATLPPWMNQWGLVQYYGQDIDPTCVSMAKTNLMLYGLNGFAARCLMAAMPDEQKAPAPVGETVQLAFDFQPAP